MPQDLSPVLVGLLAARPPERLAVGAVIATLRWWSSTRRHHPGPEDERPALRAAENFALLVLCFALSAAALASI